MKAKNVVYLLLVFVLTGLLVFGVYNGLTIGNKEIIPGVSKMRLGLDIAGGVRLVYRPEGNEATSEGLKVAQRVFRNRLDVKGLNEATVTIDETNPENPMIVVEIPGFTDPKEASSFLGQTAKLQFVEPDGTVVMEGEDIVGAKAMYGQVSESLAGNEYYIQLTISEGASAKFSEATGRLVGQTISIVLDGKELSAPGVASKIDTLNPIITNSAYTYESAQEMAELISSGALPFTLAIENEEYIGPTIGQEAFNVTLKAGFVAAIAIVLILLFIYKLPGLMTVVCLTLYGAIFILIHQWGDITITLPGIAGIILTLAMAVDASVIVYERLREEFIAGKTLKTAVDLSFGRAMSAVRDANVTTIISGAILWYFGTGPVKGFAIALFVGTILSFLISMFVLRFVMKCTAQVFDTKNKKIYGV